jgi:hypothetical protein
MTTITNRRAAVAGVVLTALAATACNTATANPDDSPEDSPGVTEPFDPTRIYPPTNLPRVDQPTSIPRIYPPTDLPVRGVPAGRTGE